MRVAKQEPVALLVRVTLSDALHEVRWRKAAVLHDVDDAVHQLRVRCRRLRTDLRTFRAFYDDQRVQLLRHELGWLSGSLDAARDLEVLSVRVARTAARGAEEPLAVDFLVEELDDLHREAYEAAARELEGSRYDELVATLEEVARRPHLSAKAERPCAEVLPPLVDRAWSHLAGACGRLGVQAAEADWHSTRILAKRARYTAETASQALGHRTERVAEEAKVVQELLGEHHDAVVTAQRVTELAQHHRGARALTCGRLVERERVLAQETEYAFLESWPRIRRLVEAG